MKISLLYSGEAGDGVAPGTLRRAFEAAGHELLYAAERDIDFERALDDSTELVVAAGGDGTVSAVRVLSAQVHPDFAIAAVDAVRQWRFTPTLLNGEPVEVVMTVSVRFDLEG